MITIDNLMEEAENILAIGQEKNIIHVNEEGQKLRKNNFYRFEFGISDYILESRVVPLLLEAMRQIIKAERITGPGRRPLTLIIKLTPVQIRKLNGERPRKPPSPEDNVLSVLDLYPPEIF